MLVKVMLAVPKGASVESENPVYIASGQAAEFALKIDEGFRLDGIKTIDSKVGELTGGESEVAYQYEDGLLRFDSALYPSTFLLDVRPLETRRFFIENNIKMGTVSSNVEQGRIAEGTHIELSVEAAEGYIFVGWSKGALLTKGGGFLSYSPEFDFELVSDIFVYPNYLSKNSQYLRYDANGGTLANSEVEELYYEVNTSHYPCPNALGDTGVFAREGYALLEYNTEPDGSGVSIGLGANVYLTTSGEDVIDLYAQWVKYTDASLFSYTEQNGKITIRGYSGSESMLVIPEQIDGLPVTELGAGAISSDELLTLFVTKNIETISSRAVNGCANLETLYISDSVVRMNDRSISSCPKLANFYVNAVVLPRYLTNLGWNSPIKYKTLITEPGKRIVVISGSSSAFGLQSPLLEELLDYEYRVINYGTHAGVCALFFIEFVANQLREGDIVVMAPEPVWDSQQGSNYFNALTFQIMEGAYEAFHHVDIRNYVGVFSAFAEYNSIRSNMAEEGYEYYVEDVNANGDMLTNHADHPENYTAGGQWVNFNNILSAEGAARLNSLNQLILSKGGRFYWSFSPVNKNALVDGGDTERRQAAYRSHIVRSIDFPVISFPGDYIFPGNYFSDTDHHLNSVHSADRTIQLAKDLKARFELEAQK